MRQRTADAVVDVLVDDDHGVMPIPAELRAVVNKARAIAAGRDTGTARARLLVHGRWLSTAEIAASLCLSTHTVRDYLKQAFEKVGVSTRGGLVAKIFAEHYKGTLNPDIHTGL
ncbi:hypothetical protein ACFOWE_00580 [Planomonospora corallina]|uniref:HTH luxR-type domain-containing protein n=1 Tax=Planomonospora corallina TaxID=1806052 RepID=A0ABV8HXX1_9ACTN